MTVGIATICHDNDEPRVLVTADRMVTFGRQAGVEYEDTQPKVTPLVNNDSLTAVAVGSGATTYIDEILRSTQLAINNAEDPGLSTMSGVLNYCLAMYQTTVRDTINNQVMEPLGYTLKDLKNEDVDVPFEIQRVIAKRSNELRKQSRDGVQILIGGIGEDGAKIFQVSGMDFTNYTDMGYAVIGSGSDSARLTFIRRRYDRYCGYEEGVFTILDAKSQAEERQGVGQKLDLVALSQSNVYQFDDEDKDDLRRKLKRIEDEERDARQRVMETWDTKSP